jgi:hypothetical protein
MSWLPYALSLSLSVSLLPYNCYLRMFVLFRANAGPDPAPGTTDPEPEEGGGADGEDDTPRAATGTRLRHPPGSVT